VGLAPIYKYPIKFGDSMVQKMVLSVSCGLLVFCDFCFVFCEYFASYRACAVAMNIL